MRFLGVLFGTFVLVFMSLGAIYFWGMGQAFPKYDHPFFAPATPWIVVPHTFKDELTANPDWILWIDVYRDAHGTLVTDKIDSGMNLSDVLRPWKGRRVILNINSNVEDVDRDLTEFLKPLIDSTPILVQSEYDVILRSMKEALPNIPYGSSQSDRLRLNTFQGMAPWSGGLLPAVPFHGDVLITPFKWKAVPLINAEIAHEIHRRQKSLIIGPINSLDELHQAQSLGADGLYFKDKTLLPH